MKGKVLINIANSPINSIEQAKKIFVGLPVRNAKEKVVGIVYDCTLFGEMNGHKCVRLLFEGQNLEALLLKKDDKVSIDVKVDRIK